MRKYETQAECIANGVNPVYAGCNIIEPEDYIQNQRENARDSVIAILRRGPCNLDAVISAQAKEWNVERDLLEGWVIARLDRK